jgi:hypothetical protein
MRAFEIDLIDCYEARNCVSLTWWARKSCCHYIIVLDNPVTTLSGVLEERTNIKAFQNLMRINLKRWDMLHETDWIREISLEDYEHNLGCSLRGDGHDLTILAMSNPRASTTYLNPGASTTSLPGVGSEQF